MSGVLVAVGSSIPSGLDPVAPKLFENPNILPFTTQVDAASNTTLGRISFGKVAPSDLKVCVWGEGGAWDGVSLCPCHPACCPASPFKSPLQVPVVAPLPLIALCPHLQVTPLPPIALCPHLQVTPLPPIARCPHLQVQLNDLEGKAITGLPDQLKGTFEGIPDSYVVYTHFSLFPGTGAGSETSGQQGPTVVSESAAVHGLMTLIGRYEVVGAEAPHRLTIFFDKFRLQPAVPGDGVQLAAWLDALAPHNPGMVSCAWWIEPSGWRDEISGRPAMYPHGTDCATSTLLWARSYLIQVYPLQGSC